jgi:asparagine synthase (glutamine-hydrolysing)
MTRLLPRVRTFAVGFASPESELAWARLAARALETEHEEVVIDATQVRDELPAIIRRLDEPVADTAAVPLYFLARAAKRSVKVVLSGEGGDEGFAGYVTYERQLLGERLRGFPALPGLARALAKGAELVAPELLARATRAAALLAEPLERRYLGVARAFAEPAALRARAADALAPYWQRTRGLTPLHRLLYLDAKVWLPDDLLVKADKMTMAHGLELRVPLLDHTLLEWAFAQPDGRLLGKRLLRHAAASRVPQAILSRKKSGFQNPMAAWLRGPLADAAQAWLLAQDAWRPLGSARTRRLLHEHRRGRDRTAELFALIVLELWRNQVAAAKPAPPIRRAPPEQAIA